MTIRGLHRGLAAALATAFIALHAGDAGAGVNGREHAQRDRIRAGRHDGSLTGVETRHLVRQQGRIERYEQRSRRDDGHLGPHERARLDRMLDRSSANVYRARHNGRTGE
jgi:hypothetical protein